jgi:hypothetical protein
MRIGVASAHYDFSSWKDIPNYNSYRRIFQNNIDH